MPKAAGRTTSLTRGPDVHPSFAPVLNAFAHDQEVTCGKMFASMGLKVNGKIFAMHVKGAFVAKLPRDRVEILVRLRHVTPFDPGHGRVMKEWVAVAGDEGSWVALAREARRFVAGIATIRSRPGTVAGGGQR